MNDHTEAYLNGWAAQSYGLSHTANPYDQTRQAFSAREWDRGWSERYNAEKHQLHSLNEVDELLL